MTIQRRIKNAVKRTNVCQKYFQVKRVYQKISRQQAITKSQFLKENLTKIKVIPKYSTKARQFYNLMKRVRIDPIKGSHFFYSLDFFVMPCNYNSVLGNYTADYSMAVSSSLKPLYERYGEENTVFGERMRCVIDALELYVKRLEADNTIAEAHKAPVAAIRSIFQRPAKTLFEGLQRILFLNQILWQTNRQLNGLGRLDKLLADLYAKDIKAGVLTRETAKQILKDFFSMLHEYYCFKSNSLMGDTGQIIILGGREADGNYFCNDLTFLFIEIAKELHLPDPKVLLRCTADMPEELLKLALECIATGIGAPLLSNDDTVIPAMISCGFSEEDAYNYCTAACWEPLVPGISCDANNIASLNFSIPLTQMMATSEFLVVDSKEKLLKLYKTNLHEYIEKLLTPLTKFEFEEDPLLTLLSPLAQERRLDIVHGGAKYNNLGLTSVALGTVINSILNIDKLVFTQKRYTIEELEQKRSSNFTGCEELVRELKELAPAYGSDAPEVVEMTKQIMAFTSAEMAQYTTKYGGRFKIGLSSPNYISGADKAPATYDGRRNGEPFTVHISSAKAIPVTELLRFAMQLDYKDNRLNGNVIDFFTTPGLLKQNLGKFTALLRAGFAGGIFQLQMNVVDSKTLIAAKADPTLFPNLVVRVWGFSAYFNDLPEEYKDVLIARAVESEKIV